MSCLKRALKAWLRWLGMGVDFVLTVSGVLLAMLSAASFWEFIWIGNMAMAIVMIFYMMIFLALAGFAIDDMKKYTE